MKSARTLPSLIIRQRAAFTLTLGATLAISALAPQAHASRADRADEAEFARGRILVEPRAGLAADEFEKIIRGHGGSRRKLGQSNLHLVELQGNQPDDEVVEKLRRNPHVKYAERDRRVKSTMAVNDPYIGSAWHLTNIGANTAWDSAMGAGVTIAILDSGVDPVHPDLKASLVPGYNSYNNNTNTADVCGHGTAVAGTAAAATNNGLGVAGVAGKARIMPIRIAYLDAATNSCYSYFSTVAAGLTWAADHGARVANVSFAGVAGSSAVQSAAQYMKNKGGLVFVSAGNAGRDEGYIPTATLIAVSATDNTDTKTSWSSYGSFVALSAPGSAIWAPVKGGSYSTWHGTSFASPVAAGVAALLMSARPLLTGTQVESMLFSTAVDRGAAGRDALYGYGRVDAARAMQKALGGAAPVADTTAPAVSISAPLANSTASGSVPVNINASDNVGVARVELKVNSTVVAIDSAAPYGFSWNSAGAYNGMNTLVATAYDAAGNVKASAPVSVNVANATTVVASDTTPPTVKIINPVPGMVAGTVTISINATDNAGAAGISQTLYIDNVVVAQGKGNALAYSWASSKAAAGLHTIKAVARDVAGNSATTWFQVTK